MSKHARGAASVGLLICLLGWAVLVTEGIVRQDWRQVGTALFLLGFATLFVGAIYAVLDPEDMEEVVDWDALDDDERDALLRGEGMSGA